MTLLIKLFFLFGMIKWILHDWSDEQCVDILKNCKKALPKTGKVIIVESILPPEISETDLATKNPLCFDVACGNDVYTTLVGKERPKKEFEVLALEADFKLPNIIYGAYSYWIIELYIRRLINMELLRERNYMFFKCDN